MVEQTLPGMGNFADAAIYIRRASVASASFPDMIDDEQEFLTGPYYS